MDSLLNGTVTHGVRLTLILAPNGFGILGYGISDDDYVGVGIPLTIDARTPACYLGAMQVLGLDHERRYLTTKRARYGVYLDPEFEGHVLCHYDYDREPSNDYPNPHVQIDGSSDALDELSARLDYVTAELGRLHFPVGSRRYRPSLEDVIEFAITEGFARGRPGWRDVVSRHREDWEKIQLRVAIRRDPETARSALTDLDPDSGG